MLSSSNRFVGVVALEKLSCVFAIMACSGKTGTDTETTASGTAGASGAAGTSQSGTGGAPGTTGTSQSATGAGGAGTTGASATAGSATGVGGTGVGGSGTGTGGSSTGAGGSSFMGCSIRDTIEGCLRGSDGALVKSPVAASVSVMSSDVVAAGACQESAFDRSTSSQSPDRLSRFALKAADGRQWTLYVRIPDMPADRVRLGDTLDLTLDASEDSSAFYTTLNQTVAVGKAGRLILFVSTMNHRSYVLPDLGSYGIAVAKGAIQCEGPGTPGCGKRGYRTEVNTTGQSATMYRSETGRVGSLSFSVEASDDIIDGGNCDGKGFVQMAGVDNGAEGPTVVALSRNSGLGVCIASGTFMEAEIHGPADGARMLTGRVYRTCPQDAAACGTIDQNWGRIDPTPLTSAQQTRLAQLLGALPARDCSPRLNNNCDYCLSTTLRANGFTYTDNLCALEPCWTAEMDDVTRFIDALAPPPPRF